MYWTSFIKVIFMMMKNANKQLCNTLLVESAGHSGRESAFNPVTSPPARLQVLASVTDPGSWSRNLRARFPGGSDRGSPGRHSWQTQSPCLIALESAQLVGGGFGFARMSSTLSLPLIRPPSNSLNLAFASGPAPLRNCSCTC